MDEKNENLPETERGWDWVELEKDASRNGYILKSYSSQTLLFAKNVWYRNERLRDEDYSVTAYVIRDGTEETVKDELEFKNGDSVQGLRIPGHLTGFTIRDAGVSIPPDY